MIAIYVRVSTEEQAIKGSSIDSQLEASKDVLKYADEGFSGELLERPALNRLRKDSKLPQFELVHKEEECQNSSSFIWIAKISNLFFSKSLFI
ncbi:hypothetical protein NRS6167_13150 [Bacillus subtilis]|nr:hypothetical protein NRS6167_02021 [Bacillus subtilis]CAI6283312.1 hypothetical protein NRS6167_13150 [Bacillus subtilis]